MSLEMVEFYLVVHLELQVKIEKEWSHGKKSRAPAKARRTRSNDIRVQKE